MHWGRIFWSYIHTSTYWMQYIRYPVKKEDDRTDGWIATWMDLLPCLQCKQDAQAYLIEHPIDNKTPFDWSVHLHNHVNVKLNKIVTDMETAKNEWGSSCEKRIILFAWNIMLYVSCFLTKDDPRVSSIMQLCLQHLDHGYDNLIHTVLESEIQKINDVEDSVRQAVDSIEELVLFRHKWLRYFGMEYTNDDVPVRTVFSLRSDVSFDDIESYFQTIDAPQHVSIAPLKKDLNESQCKPCDISSTVILNSRSGEPITDQTFHITYSGIDDLSQMVEAMNTIYEISIPIDLSIDSVTLTNKYNDVRSMLSSIFDYISQNLPETNVFLDTQWYEYKSSNKYNITFFHNTDSTFNLHVTPNSTITSTDDLIITTPFSVVVQLQLLKSTDHEMEFIHWLQHDLRTSEACRIACKFFSSYEINSLQFFQQYVSPSYLSYLYTIVDRAANLCLTQTEFMNVFVVN